MKFVLRCNNVYSEAASVANRICALVLDGARYNDIVVAMCDYENTAPIFATVFSEFNIPINVDVGGKLIDRPIVKYLRDIMLSGDWLENKITIKDKTATGICKRLLQLVDGTDEVCEKVRDILNVISNTLGDQEIGLYEFNNMFCTLCTACKVSAVPKYLDRIMLVNAKEYEPAFAPYLFITGACAGAFPQSVDDTDIITGQDIAQMKIRIEPTAQLQSARMWQHAINIIESAKINVYFSYSLKNISGESVSASPLLNGTAELEVELYSKQFAKQQTLLNIGNKSAFKNNETAEYYASIKTAADLDNIRIPQISKQPRDISNPEKLFFKKGHTSVTAVENYAKCPYYGYLVNALELKPNAPKNTVPPNIIGTILHTFAEKGDIKSILKNYNLPKYLERVICKQCAEIKKYLESNTIEFKPKFFEYEISGVIDGKTIRGKADRIDTDDKGHFVVVDYKTGDPGVVRLQLPLYMHFLNEKMGLEPLGGYYLNLRKFKKIDIEPAEIPLAIEKTQEVLSGMCAGKIIKQPIHKSVCQYCPCGALCGVHND